ncbi:chemotaxis protein CheB [Undibacterium sp.]|uniref:chemotaxis protein CheB n=1 Tax=Undibacterium sp. TaxID=1914977 RepID=UPI003751CF2F
MPSKKAATASLLLTEKNGANTATEQTPAIGIAIPVGEPTTFPIVGIGASAGGLAAFEAFFSGMPKDQEADMAFVLVQHLAPDHKSLLSELIRRYTHMRVFEVEDGMPVQMNCVYIIPPNCYMAFAHGCLQLLPPLVARGLRLPIDYFFVSLADDQRERAIGVVLSGTGSDGALGIRAIKEGGGIVIAQDITSAEFDGMPASAIATGMVDYQLAPEAMVSQLMAYTKHAFTRIAHTDFSITEKSASAMKKIFVLVRAQTGHDFSLYKPSTICRRIERRMAVHQINTLDSSVKYCQQTPAEIEALFRDFLIGVTNFFRDPDVFAVLEEQVIPKLFRDKPADETIRLWVTGCSTGEEAYSLAILLVEHMEKNKQVHSVQVFATDIDSRAIAIARAGIYPASIAADITPERLARFFTLEASGTSYRIHKGIRDLLVFSEQDLIKDPPFSRLDLVSCRNLMIYLGPELQKKLIPLFHYALKPKGMLFLGTSEGIGEFESLFTVLDRKAKLYQRKEDLVGLQRRALGQFIPAISPTEVVMPSVTSSKTAFPIKLPLRELTEQAILRHLAPACVLVDAQGVILYLHGRTGMYLEPSPGEAGVQNILKMAREGLRPSLSTALNRAALTQEATQVRGLQVKTNGHFTSVDLSVQIVANGATATGNMLKTTLYLVMLDEAALQANNTSNGAVGSNFASEAPLAGATADAPDTEARINALKQELRAKDEYLQSAQEELESANEELKSSNEEMQSVNEELQSTNEELETSKEELQSVNEELCTVNNELQTKVMDLSRVNNDMNNLLAGTGIGTVFVDFQLRVLRFTPAASKIINLIESDMGRPVAHIVSNLVGYTSLVVDIKEVLDTLGQKEIEVQTTDTTWFTMRIQPYRTLTNVIEGAVISFININERKKIESELANANNLLRLAVVVRDAHDAITVQDLDGKTIAWNAGAVRLYGWSEPEALGMNVRERIPESLREGALTTLTQLSKAEMLEAYITERLTRDGKIKTVSIISSALINEEGKMYAIATTERPKETGAL